MKVRSLRWHDLSLLHRYRKACIFLNSALELTRGPLFVPTGAILSILAHAKGMYTYLCEVDPGEGSGEDGSKNHCVGQISHPAGSASAQLTFFTPGPNLACEPVVSLVESMLVPVGKRGGLHLLAEAEELSEAQVALRKAGFGIYARQSFWRLKRFLPRQKLASSEWREASRQDGAGIHFLYANLVPGLVQQVETLPSGHMNGLVYYRGSEMVAYVDVEYGFRGILVQPFIHPDAEGVAESLLDYFHGMPDVYDRPIYVRVRSYQSWLEPILYTAGAERISQQAVMVRHLAVKRRALQNVTVPVLNGKTAEPTVSVTQIETNKL